MKLSKLKRLARNRNFRYLVRDFQYHKEINILCMKLSKLKCLARNGNFTNLVKDFQYHKEINIIEVK